MIVHFHFDTECLNLFTRFEAIILVLRTIFLLKSIFD